MTPGEKVEALCANLVGQLSGPTGLCAAEFTWFRLEFDANKAVYIVELGFGEEDVADRTVGAESLDSVMDLAIQAASQPNPRFEIKAEQEKREQMERPESPMSVREELLAESDREFIQEVKGLIGESGEVSSGTNG